MASESISRSINEYLLSIDPEERLELLTDIGFVVNSDQATEVARATWQGEFEDAHVWLETAHYFGQPLVSREVEKSSEKAILFASFNEKSRPCISVSYGDSEAPKITLTGQRESLSNIDEPVSSYIAFVGSALVTNLINTEGDPIIWDPANHRAKLNAAYKNILRSFAKDPSFEIDYAAPPTSKDLAAWRLSNLGFPERVLNSLIYSKLAVFTNDKLFYMNDEDGNRIEFSASTATSYNGGSIESSQSRSVRIGRYFKAPLGNGFRAVEAFSRLSIDNGSRPMVDTGIADALCEDDQQLEGLPPFVGRSALDQPNLLDFKAKLLQGRSLTTAL